MKAVIFGCSGESLTNEERSLFERVNPLGFILFARNCQNPIQLKKLTDDLKAVVGREDVPILIDQEGGRISRLNQSFWRVPPKPQEFGDLFSVDPDGAYQAVYDNALLIGYDLLTSGLNVNCAPIADLPTEDAHPVISDRSFSSELEVNSTLCLAMIQGLQDMGIIPVLKHFPGHGRATVDSHKALPVVDTALSDLYGQDFNCFKQVLTAMNQLLRPLPWGMTAHIVYKAIDADRPATFSSSVIENVIRGHFDFQGFLVSDDIDMEALSGSKGERALYAVEAGCDAVLQCNGNLDDMIDVAAAVPEISDESLERLHESRPEKTYETVHPSELETSVKKAFEISKRVAHG